MSDRIPQDFIDELVQRVDIGEIIGNRIDIKKAGKEYKANCPFHGEKTPSFTVSPEKGFYHCFGCGAHGTALGFLMEYERLTFIEAIEELAKVVGIDVPKTKEDKIKNKRNNSLKELLSEVSIHFTSNLSQSKEAINYLKNRGIDGKNAKNFSLGFSNNSWSEILDKFGSSEKNKQRLLDAGLIIKKDDGGFYDRFRNRIMFPIKDNRGDVLGFGGRIIGNDDPKYLNSPETTLFKKGELLYALFESKEAINKTKSVIIVEGYTDVIALHKYGFNNALATLGTATTEFHIRKMFRTIDEITFCFDGDKAGYKAALKAMELSLPIIKTNKEVNFLILEKGQDPDEMMENNGPDAFKTALSNAYSLDQFLIEVMRDKYNIETVKGKANAIEDGMSLLSKVKEGIYKDLLIESFSTEFKLNENQIKRFYEDKNQKRSAGKRFSKNRQNNKKVELRPSLIKQAISILLHYPNLLNNITIEDRLNHINEKGIDILKKIITLTQGKDSIRLATILEHFQDKKIRQHLQNLSLETLIVRESEIQNEFQDILNRLYILNNKTEMKVLLKKASQNNLTKLEKSRFIELSANIKIK
ncbi:MAG: DNA primase [Gammaproteobacteria bacterium]|nr:DNA primase [Gammaproteobacteria bacterium]MDG2434035.1 DNA primase [Gammaproteobacteria bacterium]